MPPKERLSNLARTKIIATIGPACRSEAQLEALLDAGADLFRLNMAHAAHEQHAEVIDMLRRLESKRKQPIGVLVDLAGPKIRLGELPGGELECTTDAVFRFVRGEGAPAPGELTSTYDRLIDELEVGHHVMLADGTVDMIVEERTDEFAKCRVVQSGLVRSRQGINLPGVKLSVPAMSETDVDDAIWASKAGADLIGLSFVRAPEDVRQLKNLVREQSSNAMVVAKIEKQEAIARLDEIVAEADAIMVARGDLGVETDVASIAVVQKKIVAMANRHQKPVIIATQMLDSMQTARRPTRAEATDVANAILDGADACMLSGETAIGKYPRDAVAMMNRIALATEPLLQNRLAAPPAEVPIAGLRPITEAVVLGAGHIAEQLGAKLVVVASHTGVTALALSKQRGLAPTVGISDSRAVLRQMCLFWGVIPLPFEALAGSGSVLTEVESWARHDGCIEAGDHIVFLAGGPLAQIGHNRIVVHQVQ